MFKSNVKLWANAQARAAWARKLGVNMSVRKLPFGDQQGAPTLGGCRRRHGQTAGVGSDV